MNPLLTTVSAGLVAAFLAWLWWLDRSAAPRRQADADMRLMDALADTRQPEPFLPLVTPDRVDWDAIDLDRLFANAVAGHALPAAIPPHRRTR